MSNEYGDHAWFPYRALKSNRDPLQPDFLETDCRTVVHLVISIQSFPLAQKPPIAVPGMLERPYPDITSWTQRKVGLREGLLRLEELLHRENIPATFAIEADATSEIEAFRDSIIDMKNSVVAGGLNAAALHCAPEAPLVERARIEDVLTRVSAFADRQIDSWHSPSGVHSPNTMNLLCQTGIKKLLDLNNDELPFEIRTDFGSMLSLPWQHFSSDLHCLYVCKQPPAEYLADLTEGIRWISARRHNAGPAVQTIPLHPWIIGAPHRFRLFAAALRQWKALPGVQFCNSDEIASARRLQPLNES